MQLIQNLSNSGSADPEIAGHFSTVFGKSRVQKTLVQPSLGQRITLNRQRLGDCRIERFETGPRSKFDYLPST